jgi:hypothetical protein
LSFFASIRVHSRPFAVHLRAYVGCLLAKQNAIVRPQRDTLFSLGVFDLDAGPVTVILPNAGKHFMSMQVMDEDMYTPQVIYDPGSYTFTREQIDTRCVVLVVRILVDYRLQCRGVLPVQRA